MPLKSMIFFSCLVLLFQECGQLLGRHVTDEPALFLVIILILFAVHGGLEGVVEFLLPVRGDAIRDDPEVPRPDRDLFVAFLRDAGDVGDGEIPLRGPDQKDTQFIRLHEREDRWEFGERGVHMAPEQAGHQRTGALEGHVGEFRPGDHLDAQGGGVVIGPHAGVPHLHLAGVGLGITDEFLEGLPGGVDLDGQGRAHVDHHQEGIDLFVADPGSGGVLGQEEALVHDPRRVAVRWGIGHEIPADGPAPAGLVDDLYGPVDGLFKGRLQELGIDRTPAARCPGDDELDGPAGKLFLSRSPSGRQQQENPRDRQNEPRSFYRNHSYLLRKRNLILLDLFQELLAPLLDT